MQKTVNRPLPCILTDAELQQMGQDLADKIQHENRLRAELKSYVSLKKSDIDINSESIAAISDAIRTGEVERVVECTVEYNFPTEGRKRITRQDTLSYWDDNMSNDDYDQAELTFENGATVVGGTKIKKNNKAEDF